MIQRGAVMAGVLGLVAACAGPPADVRPGREPSPPSVVLISLDTLRPDHLSGYGAPRGTSPGLDALAARGTAFATARCQSTGTLTSHLSLLTSLYPRHFRITRPDGENVNMFRTSLRIPDEVITLAEVLSGHGYDTAAFTGGGFVGARYGFDQGFDTFEENRDRFEGLSVSLPRIRAFLEGRGPDAAPLFLFVHTYDVHEPYRVPGALARRWSRSTFEELAITLGYRPVPSALNERMGDVTSAIAREVEDQYDNGIRFTDGLVRSLLRLLAANGLGETALVILVSDHGEEFLEHGRFNHGPTIYEELARVPLVLRGPGVPRRGLVSAPVALLDVAPTVLELAGLPAVSQFAGRSLVPLLEGGPAGTAAAAALRDRPVLLEVPDQRRDVHGLVRGDEKLVVHGERGETEWFDLAADPRERSPRGEDGAGGTALADALRELETAVDAEGRRNGWRAVPRGAPASADSLAEVRAQLEALGYVE